jgi:hypothetical protein
MKNKNMSLEHLKTKRILDLSPYKASEDAKNKSKTTEK